MVEKAKPFIKWAGGKGSLITQLQTFFPEVLRNNKINRYIEPFLGGGAILIEVLQTYPVEEAYAFDINKDLINAYNRVKDSVESLIKILGKMEKEYLRGTIEQRKQYYYQKREEYNSYEISKNTKSVKRAAQFIFLNRTCFNGLYRVNRNGKFNVPIGSYKNPKICDKDNLRKLSKLLQCVTFQYGDYKNSYSYVTNNSFVYFDPPYRPLTRTSNFTSYSKEIFDDEKQKELAKFYESLDKKKAKLMLSNSNPKNSNKKDTFFDELYKEFMIKEVQAKRMINVNAKARGLVSEIVVMNYPTK